MRFIVFIQKHVRFAIVTAVAIVFAGVGLYGDATGAAWLGFPSWAWIGISLAIFFVAVISLLFSWWNASEVKAAPPQAAKVVTLPEPKKARGSHYDATDRQLVREGLRELEAEFWDHISPAQQGIYNLGNQSYHEVQAGDVGSATVSISTIESHTDALKQARSRLAKRFIHGRDVGNEAWAIMGSRDQLNATITTTEAYVSALKGAIGSDNPIVFDFTKMRQNEMHRAHDEAAGWIQRTIEGIRIRRSELGGD